MLILIGGDGDEAGFWEDESVHERMAGRAEKSLNLVILGKISRKFLDIFGSLTYVHLC